VFYSRTRPLLDDCCGLIGGGDSDWIRTDKAQTTHLSVRCSDPGLAPFDQAAFGNGNANAGLREGICLSFDFMESTI
jgi:hypothetical protein